MKEKLLFIFLLLLLTSNLVLAQTKTIRGAVKDANTNAPLSGVSITATETKQGTTTDDQGQFSLQVPTSTKSILVSMVNYQTQTVDINSDVPLTISLATIIRGMDEVVVVGYGTQKKKDLTGAVSTIGSKDVGGRQTVQISEALSGSIAGVSVTRSSSEPGAGSNILIRGITTIGTNSPLVIVDGVPVGSIDNVNPNDVETLTVLKDAASAAIYGSRGAAGVVLITTKRAKNGQGSLEYNYEYGVQKPTALPRYVGVQDYMRLFNEQVVNDGAATGPYPQALIDNYLDSNLVNPDKFPNTDWQKAVMTRDYAPRQRHDLVFTMGTGKIKTKASLGYQNAGAFYTGRKYERYLFRVNNDLQVNDRMSVNLDIFYKRTNNQGNANELSDVYNPIYEGRVMPPLYDDLLSDGRLAEGKDGRNPVAELRTGGFQKTLGHQIGGRMQFNYKPVKGLSLTALVAPIFDLDKGKNYLQKIPGFTQPDGSPSNAVNRAQTFLSESRTEGFTINGQLLANYNIQIEDHGIDVLAGFEENYRSFESLGASRTGFPLPGFPYLNSGSIELRNNSGNANASGLHSLFGRLQYNFKSKYYIQGNIRSDKSSRFAKEYRTAVFPSVSAGWAISEELFMQNIKWLSYLKLRGSWGKAGNERLLDQDGNPAYYPYQATLDFSNALFYQGNAVVSQPGAGQPVYAVEDISWETSRTADVGLDATFLNNKLSLTADYYQRRTFDILLPLDIPLNIGFDRPNQNAGILNVKGWELELSWRDRIGKLYYSVAANLSDAKSTVGDLRGTQRESNSQITRDGSEFNEWFGYLSNGLFQTQTELTGAPVVNPNTKPGDVRYVDVNKDGIINANDRVLLGGSLPRYFYGGNIRMDYQGFDFNLAFQGVGKKLSRLPSETVQPFAEAFGNVSQEMLGKFWSVKNTPEQNLQAIYPRLSRTSNASNYAISDYWLMSGAYFRVKNITLGYTLKNNLIKKAGIQSLRFYAAVNDLFSISKFPKYLDPEAASYAYPIVTTLMAGATIRF